MSSFNELYKSQIENQNLIIEKGKYDFMIQDKETKLSAPFDDPRFASYHVQQLISEIGEVLDADKRWKSFRNEKYDTEHKLEEIADCFIVLMNIAIFSGASEEDMYEAIRKKLEIVRERIKSL